MEGGCCAKRSDKVVVGPWAGWYVLALLQGRAKVTGRHRATNIIHENGPLEWN